MKNKIQIYGVLGLIGTLGVGIGQFLMHYSAIGYEGQDLFNFFKDIPRKNVRIGHYLAVLFLPFYFAGYWHLYLIFLPSKPQSAKWFYRLSVYFFTIFSVWIGSQAILSIMVRDDFNNGIEHYLLYKQGLIWFAYIVFFFISILFFYMVWAGKTLLPKWVAFLNPALLLGIIYGISSLAPSLGKLLLSTPLNIAHFICFGTTTYFVFKSKISFPSNLDI